jgi:glutamate-ammonia-ligase adenylyltransferase
MHLKQDAGGVADIEFIVQYLVLAHAADHPALLTYTDNIRVLDTVENEQLLPANDVQLLRSSYLALRERLHRQALQEASPIVPLDDALIQLRDGVIVLKNRILGPASAASDTPS